jgi:acetoin:2,6-dichlorophenolindophenol oxidoreductase subunit alpha
VTVSYELASSSDRAGGQAGLAEPDGLEFYARMSFLRRFLEKADSLYRQGQIHGPVHLGLGQEAIAIGAASVLRPDDYSIGTYRGHAHALARGAPPGAVLAELLGRTGGICGGKGGSMHITSVEHGYYGSYAIVGAHLPVACGLAWAAKIRHTDQVTVCFFGDGAVNIGAFHEALNLRSRAALLRAGTPEAALDEIDARAGRPHRPGQGRARTAST